MADSVLDPAATEAFAETVFANLAGTLLAPMVVLGHRLGLLKDLWKHGPATAAELATRVNANERYVREWASAMACGKYLTYDATTKRFTLPPEHAAVLVDEQSPYHLGTIYDEVVPLYKVVDRVAAAFRTGGGVPYDAYEPAFWNGLEAETSPLFDHQLVQAWLPEMPALAKRLEDGIDVADVGCGAGRALIKLAQAFPRSRFTGHDFFAPQLERARANAAAAGVADRIEFILADATGGLAGTYDLITTFDVVHDTKDPLQFLRSIRRALRPEGTYLLLEYTAADALEDNIGVLGSYLFSASVLYCMTTSLSQGGEGLGTAGMPEAKVRELTALAGFSSVRRVPTPSPINSLFEARP